MESSLLPFKSMTINLSEASPPLEQSVNQASAVSSTWGATKFMRMKGSTSNPPGTASLNRAVGLPCSWWVSKTPVLVTCLWHPSQAGQVQMMQTLLSLCATSCLRFAQDPPPPGSLPCRTFPCCGLQAGYPASILFSCISDPGSLPPLGTNK